MEYNKPTLTLVGEATAVVLGMGFGITENQDNRSTANGLLGLDE